MNRAPESTFVRLIAVGLLTLTACTEVNNPLGEAHGDDRVLSDQSVSSDDSSAVDSLARLAALAIADPAIRNNLFQDLRDSPFPEHRIHLPSYLSGARGTALSDAIAQKGKISRSDVFALASRRGGIQLIMRRSPDRMSWTGTNDIVVAGSIYTLQQRRERLRQNPYNEVAYSVSGAQVAHGLLLESPYPYLEVTPFETDFGSDPERVRSMASRIIGQQLAQPMKSSRSFESVEIA
jgi:hypothetical protein